MVFSVTVNTAERTPAQGPKLVEARVGSSPLKATRGAHFLCGKPGSLSPEEERGSTGGCVPRDAGWGLRTGSRRSLDTQGSRRRLT